MNTRTHVATAKRTLFIDFDMYADNDPDFKQELIALIIDNLKELQEAYGVSVKNRDTVHFSKACHKMKTTLVMLEDDELNAIVDDLKNLDAGPCVVSRFKNTITELIAILLGVK